MLLQGELDAKYRGVESKLVYSACKRLFAQLPLAALVQRTTLILHGGEQHGFSSFNSSLEVRFVNLLKPASSSFSALQAKLQV